jgi:hypothetical protein
MIVEKRAQGEMVLSGEMEEDVLKRVGEKIEIVEVKVAAVEGQVSGLTLPVDPAATLVAQQTNDQAKVVLGEAREALDQKDLGTALIKTIESKELTKQAEQIAAEAITVAANAAEETPCAECNLNENPDLTNTPENIDNVTNPDANTNTVDSGTNTNTVKTYVPVKVVTPPPPAEPVIDESTLKVGIDLIQEPAAE